jgi:hypothetical protein
MNAMRYIVVLSIFTVLMVLMSSCTYSITQVHTEGSASDVVDEQQTPTANTTATATVPVKAV